MQKNIGYRIMCLSLMFLLLLFAFFSFTPAVYSGGQAACWGCAVYEGRLYCELLGVGSDNCGQSSPGNCTLSGVPCNASGVN